MAGFGVMRNVMRLATVAHDYLLKLLAQPGPAARPEKRVGHLIEPEGSCHEEGARSMGWLTFACLPEPPSRFRIERRVWNFANAC